MATLIVKGVEEGKFPIEVDTVTIGRDMSNVLTLGDTKVSRKHCRIDKEGGTFSIQDLESSNGTCVNGELIKERKKLTDEDSIEIGDTLIIFTLKEPDEITSFSEFLPKSEEETAPKPTPPAGHVSDIPHPSLRGTKSRSNLSPPDVVGELARPSGKPSTLAGEEMAGEDTDTPLIKSLASLEKELKVRTPDALLRDRRNLRTLYEVNQVISSIFDLNEVLNRILDIALKVLRAERGFIMLKDEQTGELTPQAVRNRDAQEITISKTIVKKVFDSGKSIVTDDAMSDDRFSGGKSIVDYHIRSCLCVPLKSKDKVLGIIHIDNKVSRRTFTEEDLELLSAIGAEAGVLVENAKLYAANLKAERLAAIGQTIAGLSHYVKNILTGVEGGNTLVDMGISNGNQELLKKGWKVVRSSNDRISHLVLNMLDFSRERKPVREKVTINEVINDVISLLEERCKQKAVGIKANLAKSIPEIEVDPTGIHRAILNIVTNAIDAVEKKEGKIVISTVLNPSSQIQISISDNGSGIPQEDIPKIFDIFHSSKGAGGTGLGLAVTKKIIDEHQGKIEVDSKEGQGTTFTIIL
jgi:signal transduction histidine kinase